MAAAPLNYGKTFAPKRKHLLALGNVGRRREAATAQLSFSAACGGHVPLLKTATSMPRQAHERHGRLQ
jgi:hypothetical protein